MFKNGDIVVCNDSSGNLLNRVDVTGKVVKDLGIFILIDINNIGIRGFFASDVTLKIENQEIAKRFGQLV